MNRRLFLASLGAFTGGAVVAMSRRGACAVPDSAILSISVISRRPDLYHGWPTVCRRANGELLVGYSGGREGHVCPFGRNELIRSIDDGETWSDPVVLNDSVLDDRDVGVLETARGTLLVNWFDSLAWLPAYQGEVAARAAGKGTWSEERFARWTAAYEAIPEELLAAGAEQSWLLRSTDGGATWDGPHKVACNSCHGPTQLSDGRVLFAGVGQHPERGKRCTAVWQSLDDGVTFEFLAEISPREGDDSAAYHELHAVEASNGALIVQIRNHNPANDGETLQTHSLDGGQTWSAPCSIGVWGLPSFLTRLRDGRLVMTYGHRRPPFGNQARISEDHGQTWSDAIVISGDGIGGDLGYPSTVELPDGTLLTVWYEVMAESPNAVLRQAKWQLRD